MSFMSKWFYIQILAACVFQVSGLFRDASIGNAINIVVVRLILLEQDEVKIYFWVFDVMVCKPLLLIVTVLKNRQ